MPVARSSHVAEVEFDQEELTRHVREVAGPLIAKQLNMEAGDLPRFDEIDVHFTSRDTGATGFKYTATARYRKGATKGN